MKKPLVSIIVPCYNQAQFLKESLQSVLDQTYEEWECIIVNDGSPDDTSQVASVWCKLDRRFRYLDQQNKGLSGARNAGINAARGKFILPLDADDILHKDFINKLLPVIEKDDEVKAVSCYSKFFRKNLSNVVHELKPMSGSLRSLIFENVLMATSMYRKEDFERVGGYDESMRDGFEDWDFWISMLKNGGRYEIVKEFLFNYRKSSSSMLVDTLLNHRENNMKYVFKKHKDIYIEHFDAYTDYLFFILEREKGNSHSSTSLKTKIEQSGNWIKRYIAKK